MAIFFITQAFDYGAVLKDLKGAQNLQNVANCALAYQVFSVAGK